MRKAALELGARAARAERGGKRPRRLTLDVDSLPIEVHGHQPKGEWNGHYRGRSYHPLVTSVAETGDMLDHYRQRGTAEGHMGELKDVLAPALSSTNRPKSHWRGRRPQRASQAVDAFACNEVRLLISILAYQLMHVARRAMARATATGWSLTPPARARPARRRQDYPLRAPDDARALWQRRALLRRALAGDRQDVLGRFLTTTA